MHTAVQPAAGPKGRRGGQQAQQQRPAARRPGTALAPALPGRGGAAAPLGEPRHTGALRNHHAPSKAGAAGRPTSPPQPPWVDAAAYLGSEREVQRATGSYGPGAVLRQPAARLPRPRELRPHEDADEGRGGCAGGCYEDEDGARLDGPGAGDPHPQPHPQPAAATLAPVLAAPTAPAGAAAHAGGRPASPSREAQPLHSAVGQAQAQAQAEQAEQTGGAVPRLPLHLLGRPHTAPHTVPRTAAGPLGAGAPPVGPGPSGAAALAPLQQQQQWREGLGGGGVDAETEAERAALPAEPPPRQPSVVVLPKGAPFAGSPGGALSPRRLGSADLLAGRSGSPRPTTAPLGPGGAAARRRGALMQQTPAAAAGGGGGGSPPGRSRRTRDGQAGASPRTK